MPTAWIVEKTIYYVCDKEVTSEAEALTAAKRAGSYEWSDDERGPIAYEDEVLELEDIPKLLQNAPKST